MIKARWDSPALGESVHKPDSDDEEWMSSIDGEGRKEGVLNHQVQFNPTHFEIIKLFLETLINLSSSIQGLPLFLRPFFTHSLDRRMCWVLIDFEIRDSQSQPGSVAFQDSTPNLIRHSTTAFGDGIQILYYISLSPLMIDLLECVNRAFVKTMLRILDQGSIKTERGWSLLYWWTISETNPPTQPRLLSKHFFWGGFEVRPKWSIEVKHTCVSWTWINISVIFFFKIIYCPDHHPFLSSSPKIITGTRHLGSLEPKCELDWRSVHTSPQSQPWCSETIVHPTWCRLMSSNQSQSSLLWRRDLNPILLIWL